MSGEGEGGASGASGRGRSPSTSGDDARADADESGYPRDDYWRESNGEDPAPDPREVPEPAQGYSFEDPEERGGEEPEDGSRERGDASDRDDARIVER